MIKTIDNTKKSYYTIIKLKEITKNQEQKKRERSRKMNELEKKALNEVLRTVRLINQKVAEVVELQSQQELAISYLRGIMDGSVSD